MNFAVAETKTTARRRYMVAIAGVTAVGMIAAPFGFYPIFLMNILCYALFASAFNLLIGYVGLLVLACSPFSELPLTSPLTPLRSGACQPS